jgi:hypothetical protein
MKLWRAIKAIDWKDVFSRAAWTFVQVLLTTFIVSGESILDLLFKAEWEQLWVLTVAITLSGVASGLSAVKTILVQVIRSLREAVE